MLKFIAINLDLNYRLISNYDNCTGFEKPTTVYFCNRHNQTPPPLRAFRDKF